MGLICCLGQQRGQDDQPDTAEPPLQSEPCGAQSKADPPLPMPHPCTNTATGVKLGLEKSRLSHFLSDYPITHRPAPDSAHLHPHITTSTPICTVTNRSPNLPQSYCLLCCGECLHKGKNLRIHQHAAAAVYTLPCCHCCCWQHMQTNMDPAVTTLQNALQLGCK